MKDSRGHGSNGTGKLVGGVNGAKGGYNFKKFWAGSATQSVANDVAAGRVKTVGPGAANFDRASGGAGSGVAVTAGDHGQDWGAAQALNNGPKSAPVPVHNGMSNYAGVEAPDDLRTE